MANPDRKGGGGLSLQTLAIASAASVTAAMVSSRLFPPGTVYASALTPVIVAAVSELLARPADRVTRLREQRRMMVPERRGARVPGGDPHPLSGAPDFAFGAAAEEELSANGNANGGAEPPVRIHGRRRWGRIHPKVAIATGLAAFAIAVAFLTLPELIFGGAVTTKHRTTFFGGGSTSVQKQSKPTEQKTQTETTPSTVTETVPATPPQSSPTTTETTPTDTSTQTTPTETQTTPTDTGTSTTPAPAGAAPAAP